MFENLDSPLLRLVKIVGKIASDHGVRSFLIGGCVRDLVLKRKILDLDFAVEDDAFAVAQDFAKRLNGKIIIYRQFMTATVTLSDDKAVDFSTLRQEEYPYPGALPVVRKGSLTDDLYRRDFSINAMAACVNPDNFAEIFDAFEGMKDIARKKVRVLHEKSFMDDPTRMLRAVRFEQRLGFKLESHTEELLKKALKSNALASVKSQRLFEEFRKNLKEPLALRNLMRLSKLGLLNKTGWGMSLTTRHRIVLRQLDRILVQISKHALSDEKINAWLIRLMILFDGVSNSKIKGLMETWALSSIDRTKVSSARGMLQAFRSKTLKSCSQEELFQMLRVKSIEELLFVWAYEPRPAVRSLVIKALTKWRRVSLKISGDDLKREGIPAGKVYKKLLDDVLYCVAQGRCQSKKEQLAYVRKSHLFSGK